MSRYTAHILAVCLTLAAPAAQAESPAIDVVARDGVMQILNRLPEDNKAFDTCTKLSAQALVTYSEYHATGRDTEALYAISDTMQARFAKNNTYVCGLYALGSAYRAREARLPASEALTAVAAAMNWASANAVPYDSDIAASVLFASAAASNLIGTPLSSTEPVFCLAARSKLPEADAVLDVWPQTPACRAGEDKPKREPVQTASAPQSSAVAMSLTAEPAPARSAPAPDPIVDAAPETETETRIDTALVTAAPEPEAEPGPPPPAVNAAWREPPRQPAPRPTPAPSSGYSDCQIFSTAYWSDGGDLVTVEDTFCQTEEGDYSQVSTAFTVESAG